MINIKKNWPVILILAIAIVFGAMTWPKGPDIRIGEYYKELKIHQGLDLLGGTHLVYEADMSKIPAADRGNALESVKTVIEQIIISQIIIFILSLLGLYRLNWAVNNLNFALIMDIEAAPSAFS